MTENLMLEHEKLHVYQCAMQFFALSTQMLDHFPKGNASISDQLKRASLSIPLNIAEGAGRFRKGEKVQFYAIARASAMECGAILDACKISKVVEESFIEEGKNLIVRIVSMLTKMCR